MTNKQVIKAFLNGETLATKNLHTDGTRLINYTTCIAQKRPDGSIVVNSTKYSTITSKIQFNVRYLATMYEEVTDVPINTLYLNKYYPS